MKNIWFCGSGTVLTLVLMALPGSAGGEHGFFSLINLQLGNWFPLMAVVFTVLVLVFALRPVLRPMAPVCLVLSMVSQVLSWCLFNTMTLMGTCVLLLQISVAVQWREPSLPAPCVQNT